jgi:rubrerythrin
MGRQDAYLDKYLDASRTLALHEFDWRRANDHPISREVERALVYMLRIEGQTLFYVRDLLNTRTAYIPEVSSFLTVWLYEEERHSRMFRRFLRERGVVLPEDDHAQVRRASLVGLREIIEAKLARLMALSTDHFVAVHMVWGALQELSTIHAYERLAKISNHPFLAELCESIAKDERRHFAFYYNQSRRFLEPRPAQVLTRALVKTWWKPVGFGVHAPAHASLHVNYLFGDDEGQQALQRMDATISKLPGLEGLTVYQDAGRAARQVVAERSAAGLDFEDWVPVPV